MNTKMIDALPRLLERLSTGEGLHIPTLVKELGVSSSTIRDHFERYLVPLPLAEIKYDGSTKNWTAKPNFLSETLLSADEMIVIKILEESSSSFGDNFSEQTRKLFARFRKRSSLRIYKKVKMEKLDEKDEKNLAIIQNAIEKQQTLMCLFHGKERVINPLKIVQLEGYWYLFLWDVNDDIMKKFYFKEIEDIQIEGSTYTDTKKEIIAKLDQAITAYFKDQESFEVELQVHKKVSVYLKRLPVSPTQQFLPCIDPNYEKLTLQVTDNMEIIPTIQRYLPYIKVLSPDSLIKEIEQNLKDYYEINLT